MTSVWAPSQIFQGWAVELPPWVSWLGTRRGYVGSTMQAPASSEVRYYKHKCSGCGGAHPSLRCFKQGKGHSRGAGHKRQDAGDGGKDAATASTAKIKSPRHFVRLVKVHREDLRV